MKKRPESKEYNPYYETYIGKVGEGDILSILSQQSQTIPAFFKGLAADRWDYRYANGKWTIKEVIQHVIDTERIFAYRALRVARQDQTPLPGFEENDYVPTSFANDRSRAELLADYKAVRQATVSLFDSFRDDMLFQMGTASNSPISVRALGFITIGHENHHCQVIKERYL